MFKDRRPNSGDRLTDTAWRHLNTSEEDGQSTIVCEDNGIDSGQSLSDYPDYDAEEYLHYSDPDVEDGQLTGTASPKMSLTASASFVHHHGQMLRAFRSVQSEVAELMQRETELKKEKFEIVWKGKEAYRSREAELLARIDELVHETERLSGELVSKDEDDSKDELLRENARLVAEMDVMDKAWAQKLSAISNESIKNMGVLSRAHRRKIALLENRLLAAEQSIEDHAMTEALRAENAEFQRRLQDLEQHITVLEGKKPTPPGKKKKPAKNAPASDNLRKLYVADLNSEFAKKLEEQDRIAKSQAASMEETASQLRQRVAELERSRSTKETKNNQLADQAYYLRNALDEVVRLNAVVAEQNDTIHRQEDKYRELQKRDLLSGDYQTSLPNQYIGSPKEVEQNSAPPSSVSDDSFGNETDSAASEEQLEIPAEDPNEIENQYLDEEQMPGNAAISEGKPDLLEETDAGLQGEVEALRRQNQYLQEKNDLLNIQDKKWRRTFEDFTHRAADVQRKDASKRQIKKGFKHLRKIIRDGDLESD